VRVVPDRAALAEAAAAEFTAAATAALGARDRFTVALAGGSTPLDLYRRLASREYAARVPWPGVHFFWGDERHVPPDHPDSNVGAARAALLDHVPVPPSNIHRVPAELADAEAAARAYEDELSRWFAPAGGAPPRFDLVLLGLGADGHTASLFPGSAALAERRRWVVAPWIEKLAAHRITVTLPVLNAAARVLFLVSGKDKAPALRQVLAGPRRPEELPAQAVEPRDGEVIWLVDGEAAAEWRAAGRGS
jgi:6-phosphogluconolactonase